MNVWRLEKQEAGRGWEGQVGVYFGEAFGVEVDETGRGVENGVEWLACGARGVVGVVDCVLHECLVNNNEFNVQEGVGRVT
jgi:hypothetical protein